MPKYWKLDGQNPYHLNTSRPPAPPWVLDEPVRYPNQHTHYLTTSSGLHRTVTTQQGHGGGTLLRATVLAMLTPTNSP